MDEDDEFGDLYSDVLRPFQPPAVLPPPLRSIDLNLRSQDQDRAEANSASASRVSDNDAFKLSTALSQDANRQAIGNGGGDDKDMNFDIEEPDADSTPAIPGLGTDRGVTQGKTVTEQVGDGGYGGQGEGDDWDSDSEDDLQIVLNDSSRNVMIGADRRSKMGDNEDDDDDDDDEEPLVIVADTDPNQPMEEQLWGEDGVQTVDGDGKDGGEAGKGSGPGGAVGPPKTGYSSHGYHPFHSKFKYVASDSPVHSSSSDDLAAFLETELESDSDSSSESFPREEAEDDAEVSNHRLKRRKLDHLETVDEIYTEDVASVTFSEEISEASSSKLPCEHPGTFGNMCFVCGQKVEVTGVSFGYIHKGIKLHQDEVSRLRDMDMKGLQSRRKLCLVLDLDHTLLNSTVLRDLKPEEEYLKSHTHSLQDVSGGNLFMLEFMQMMTKLRPFVHSFLKEASEMFVMYIYTMGDRPYARQMAKLLDPKGEYFGERIISRDDGTVRHQKSLDVVLGQEKAVLILDDTENAWPGHKENLIVIERYHFFASSCKQFDHRYQSLSQLKSDESEPDGALATVLKVLKQTHSLFFEDGGEDLSSRDVRSLLKQVRKEILKGCKVVFSRVFPTKSQAEDHPVWKVAEGLGATCATEVDASVTHVVAMDVGTEKVRWAIREKKFVVHRGWIDAAKYLWKKQPEENFGLEQLKKQATEEVER